MNFTLFKTNIQLPALKTILCSLLCFIGIKSFGQQNSTGKMHFGIIYPLSTNGTHAPLDTNTLSIHLLAGVSAAERGASFAGISNIVRNDTKGFQFAGISNHVAKQTNGGLFSGFLNTYGGGNVCAVAGFANITNDVKGIQIAGFINKAANITGPQIGGFINKAKDIKGSQIAGFINIAGKVKGAQIAGFINVADSSDYPIGIINIIKNGEKSISLTTDETFTTMLSFRSGGKVLYGIIGLGYNFKNSDEVYAFEAGLGAHLFQSNSFRLNTEISGIGLESFKAGEYFKTSLRLMPAIKITRNLEIFGGPSLNYLNTNTIEGLKLHKDYISTWENKWGSNFQALYIGYQGGIQYIF
ncbi:MAG: hypothetical protein P0Y49_08520 [Candidatus Pedobacter colombiensis]|uniref:Uncharacterized protein n=1 Tax=Candidatus Pedobacter colombiensis TaxID=3121371 RepID=A0AAJ6BAE4_9SPHI|nr:hypothetical protein [Pedobacter sp.]WEK21183.1 MAG: hypothetical protein P0Y49_08520 [Pedobacter sp.]